MADNRDNIAQAIMEQQGGGGLKYTAGGQLDQNDAGNIAYYYKMMGGGGGGGAPQPLPYTPPPQPQYQPPQPTAPAPQPAAPSGGGGLKMINGQIDQNDPGNIAAYYRMMGMGGGGAAPQQPQQPQQQPQQPSPDVVQNYRQQQNEWAPQQPAYQPQPVAYSPQGVAAIPGNFGPDQVQAMGPQIMALQAQGQQIPDWQMQVLRAYQGGMQPGTTLAIQGSPAGGMGPTMGTPQIQAPGGSYGDGEGLGGYGGGSGLGGVSGGSDFFGGGGSPYQPQAPAADFNSRFGNWTQSYTPGYFDSTFGSLPGQPYGPGYFDNTFGSVSGSGGTSFVPQGNY